MIDDTDRIIIELLRQDGRRTVRDIAQRIGLTSALAMARIEKLEQTGVIRGYTVTIDASKIGNELEAVIALRSTASLHLIVSATEGLPEVTEVLSLADDHNTIIRVRAAGTHELQHVVDIICKNDWVIDTKTTVVSSTWSRYS